MACSIFSFSAPRKLISFQTQAGFNSVNREIQIKGKKALLIKQF